MLKGTLSLCRYIQNPVAFRTLHLLNKKPGNLTCYCRASSGKQNAIATAIQICYSKCMTHAAHMRRTNLVLDEQLLEDATRLLGAKTYSATVNTALQEVIRLRKVQSISRFFGTDIWEGDLAAMREDPPAKP